VLRLNGAIPENIFVYTMGSFMELQVQGGLLIIGIQIQGEFWKGACKLIWQVSGSLESDRLTCMPLELHLLPTIYLLSSVNEHKHALSMPILFPAFSVCQQCNQFISGFTPVS